jgi:ankyrin repeat protein
MDPLIAAHTGDLQKLRVALTVDNVNVATPYGPSAGWTALHYATTSGSVDCINYCVQMGANVNARDIDGCTPLYYASFRHLNVVRVLLDAGAMVDATDNDGWTPLHRAICNKGVDVMRLLIDRGSKVSNVKLDTRIPAIPDWVTIFVESRSKCGSVSIALIGIHKYRRTNVTGNNDINVIKLVSKHIWSMRMDDVWVTPAN